ncbi:MAG: DUF302 domain-containing protein [Saprospiraceae bacterium]|nr:DUF302 domain-containing protein [Saprospiraceae bacterium]
MKYCNCITITGTTVSEIRPVVEDALKAEGFGVLTEIDIQATMKKKLDKDYLPHIILGACNPGYADKVLSIDPNISTMLPCNVTIRELETGEIEIASIDPSLAMSAISNQELEVYAKEVNDKLQNVLQALKIK